MLHRWNLKGHETWARSAIAGAAAADPESALKIIKYTLNIIPQHRKTLFGRASNSMRVSVICQMNCVAQICQTMPSWEWSTRQPPSPRSAKVWGRSLLTPPSHLPTVFFFFFHHYFFLNPSSVPGFFLKCMQNEKVHCTFFAISIKDVMISKYLSMIFSNLCEIFIAIFFKKAKPKPLIGQNLLN